MAHALGSSLPRRAASDCPTALEELEAIHWTHLNRDYETDVLDAWKDQGCFDTVTCRLGYRFALRALSWTEAAAAGESIDLGFIVRNDGYARLINSRPAYLALTGPEQVVIELPVDAREWAAGVDSELCVQVTLPAELQPGSYQLGLWLPDASASLGDRSEYAVAFAGDSSWDAATGINGFAAQLSVE